MTVQEMADKYPSLDTIHLAIMEIARLSHAGKHGRRVRQLLEKLASFGDGWIPVGERLPNDHHEVVYAVREADGRTMSGRGAWLDDGEWYIATEDGCVSMKSCGWIVTHWRDDSPLPAPPVLESAAPAKGEK